MEKIRFFSLVKIYTKSYFYTENQTFHFSSCPVFDVKIIICLLCMHDYKQPHETNLNIKKKWLPLSLFSHLQVEYEECDRFNPHEGFEILIILSFLLMIISVFCMTNLNYSKQFLYVLQIHYSLLFLVWMFKKAKWI